jgi:hypothetical protein
MNKENNKKSMDSRLSESVNSKKIIEYQLGGVGASNDTKKIVVE